MPKVRTTLDGKITWKVGTQLVAHCPPRRRVEEKTVPVVVATVGRKYVTIEPVNPDDRLPYPLSAQGARLYMTNGALEGFSLDGAWRLYASMEHLSQVLATKAKQEDLTDWINVHQYGRRLKDKPLLVDALHAFLVEQGEIEAD